MKLIQSTFIKRYNRFLADVQVKNTVMAVHCPNSGSMKGLLNPGATAWISKADNPNRRLSHTLEMIEVDGTCVGINTHRPNDIVASAIQNKTLDIFADYTDLKREVTYGKGTRIDIRLTAENLPPTYIEVKNVTLKDGNIARFPDSVTDRGTKHLNTLIDIKKSGARAIMIYLVQRNDCKEFGIAKDIDPTYYTTFIKAIKSGVEVMVHPCDVTPHHIGLLPTPLPLETVYAH